MSCFEVYYNYPDEIKTLLVRKFQGVHETTTDGGTKTKRKATAVNKSNVLSYLIRKPRLSKKKKGKKSKKGAKKPRRTAGASTVVVDGIEQEMEEEKEDRTRETDGQQESSRQTRSGRSYK